MSKFETGTITVPYRNRCEDRVNVIEFDEGVVIVVADGAGGTGAGDQAAETVIREITLAASMGFHEADWCRLLQQIDFRISTGESTCVVVACSDNGIVGACVGDTQAWLILNDELHDLTKDRIRKPLLGSGEAIPVGFSHPASQGLLIVATDGFCNDVRREQLIKDIPWIDFVVLPRKLVEMVCLSSGELWDDIGIVTCRVRRTMSNRKVYRLEDLESDV